MTCGPCGRTTTTDPRPRRRDGARGVSGGDPVGGFPLLHHERHASPFEYYFSNGQSDHVFTQSYRTLHCNVVQVSSLRLARCDVVLRGDLHDFPNLCPSFWMTHAYRRARPAAGGATPSRLRERTRIHRGVSETVHIEAEPPHLLREQHRHYIFGSWSLPPKRREARVKVRQNGADDRSRRGCQPIQSPPLQGLLKYLSASRAELASGSFGASSRKRSKCVFASALPPRPTLMRPR